MAGTLCFGAVIKWAGFVFEDGDSSDKLLVILGIKPKQNIMAVLTTSQARRRPKAPGCQAEYETGAFYYLPGGMKNSFKLDTWVELHRPQELDILKFNQALANKEFHVIFNLDKGVAAGIRNCLKRSPDTSELHLSLCE
jgi:hypothetical protein